MSDAQHVVAVERGYRTWRELRDALGQAQAADAGEARSETAVETGLEYRPGDCVCLVVVRRPHRLTVSDEARALERADVAAPWRELADRLERELDVNISRRGAVWLPVVPASPALEAVVERIGRASLTFYQDLVELE